MKSLYAKPWFYWCSLSVLALTASMLWWNVFGIARINNGDGFRLLISAGVRHEDQLEWKALPRTLRYDPAAVGGPTSRLGPPELLITCVAKAEALCRFPNFDFFWLTAIYAGFYIHGLILLGRNAGAPMRIALALLGINPYWTSYLCSPYEDALFIALTPLCVYALRPQTSLKPSLGLFLLVEAIKIQMVPLGLLGLLRQSKAPLKAAFAVSMLIVLFWSVRKERVYSFINDYNRVFCGLAYSYSGVSSWPAEVSSTRDDLAKSRVSGVTLPVELIEDKDLLGSGSPKIPELSPARISHLQSTLRSGYKDLVKSNLNRIYLLISEPFLTMARSRVNHTYNFQSRVGQPIAPISTVSDRLGVVDILLLPAAVFFAGRSRRRPVAFAIAALIALYPAFVVFGDGYYEFEKHLFPVLVFSLFALIDLIFVQNVKEFEQVKAAEPALQ